MKCVIHLNSISINYQSFFFFDPATRLAGSWFPNQGTNLCPLQWKWRLLTTGPPGNSPPWIIFKKKNHLFIWLCRILVAARGIFNLCCRIFSWDMRTLSCSTWDLVSWSEIKPGHLPEQSHELSFNGRWRDKKILWGIKGPKPQPEQFSL